MDDEEEESQLRTRSRLEVHSILIAELRDRSLARFAFSFAF